MSKHMQALYSTMGMEADFRTHLSPRNPDLRKKKLSIRTSVDRGVGVSNIFSFTIKPGEVKQTECTINVEL